MKCKHTDRVVHAELFGERDERLERHAAACAACAKAASGLRKSRAVLTASRTETAPPDLWGRIESRLERPAPAVHWWGAVPRWVVPSAAAALIALAAGLWLLVGSERPDDGARIVQGGIPDAEFYLGEHMTAEQAYVYDIQANGEP